MGRNMKEETASLIYSKTHTDGPNGTNTTSPSERITHTKSGNVAMMTLYHTQAAQKA
jgi:hypothetical protein